MTRCPYCNSLCNPLRFLICTKWTPYRCPKCAKRSRLSQKRMIILAGIAGGVGGGVAAELSEGRRWIYLLLMLLILSVIMLLGTWFFCGLKCEEEKVSGAEEGKK